jgi:DNA-binding winged helix-turn-helix (wHTH) protein
VSDPSVIQLSECVVRVPESLADFGSGNTRRLEPIYLDLLLALVRAAGRTLSWEALERDAWRGKQVKPDAVRRRLKRLRERLSKNGKGAIQDIVTVRGEGLRLAPVGLPDPVGPDIDLDRDGEGVWL